MSQPAFTAEPRLTTAAELLHMPDDSHRRELVDGEMTVMAPAGEEHGVVAAEVLVSLGYHVKTHRLGKVSTAETGYMLGSDPDTVLAPDAAFVAQDRIDAIGVGKGFRVGAPDLVVEVVSPGESHGSVEAKAFRWLAGGCRMVVVVNPRRRAATVYRSRSDVLLLTENDAIDGGDVVPGWTLPLRELFG